MVHVVCYIKREAGNLPILSSLTLNVLILTYLFHSFLHLHNIKEGDRVWGSRADQI